MSHLLGFFAQAQRKRLCQICLVLLFGLAPCRDFAQSLSVSIQSSNQIAPVFGSAIFSANATGTGPLVFQWSFKNVAIPNATNSSLILGPLGFGQSGLYSVVVSDSVGHTGAAQGQLSVAQAIVSVDPQDTNQDFLLQFTNIAAASTCTSINLLRRDGTVTNEYPLENIPRVVATNVAAMAPEGLVVNSNGLAIYWGDGSVVDVGSNTVAIAGGCDGFLLLRSDTTLDSILGPSITAVPGFSNIVGISETGGGSSVALRADGTVAEWGGESLTNAPNVSNLIAVAASTRGGMGLGSDGTVVGWGDLPDDPFPGVSNVVAIAGDSETMLALTADGSVLTGGPEPAVFPCVITNAFSISVGYGHQVDSIALVGNGTPVATVQPGNQIVSEGATVWLHNRAVGVQPMSYQWQRNGTDITGATSPDLTLENVQMTDAGQYRAIATNRLGFVSSVIATITVLPVDRVPVQLGGLSVQAGGSITFSAQSQGGGALNLSALAGIGFEASSDLAHWAPMTNFQLLPNGAVTLVDPGAGNSPARFYRLSRQ